MKKKKNEAKGPQENAKGGWKRKRERGRRG